MQRASIIVLVVGILLGLALAHTAAGVTVDQLRLQPTAPTPDHALALDVRVTLPTAGQTLFTAPPTGAADNPTAHRLDLVYWQDSLAFYPQILTGQADRIDLGRFAEGSHTLTLFLHELTSAPTTREALLTDPTGFTGPGGEPFATYEVVRRELRFQVGQAGAAPEPTSAGLLIGGGLMLIRRRTASRSRCVETNHRTAGTKRSRDPVRGLPSHGSCGGMRCAAGR